MSKPQPPSTLGSTGKSLWNDVVGKYTLRADELTILASACGAADMVSDFTEAWIDSGRPLTTAGSMGQQVEHPLIGSIDKQRKAQMSFFKQLKLPDEPGGAKPNQQRDAANSRWAQAHGAGA